MIKQYNRLSILEKRIKQGLKARRILERYLRLLVAVSGRKYSNSKPNLRGRALVHNEKFTVIISKLIKALGD